jgi:hypothetical protein
MPAIIWLVIYVQSLCHDVSQTFLDLRQQPQVSQAQSEKCCSSAGPQIMQPDVMWAIIWPLTPTAASQTRRCHDLLQPKAVGSVMWRAG